MPADISIATVGTSTRYAPRREEGPWLADLSRQYTPPQQTSGQPTPRISSLSYLPHLRVGDSARRPQHLPPDAWTFSQKSFAAAAPLSGSSPLPTSGHSHATFDTHNPSDFARVKHEPDADLSMPPLMRTGPSWTYVTPHSPSAPHMWEASSASVRGNRYHPSAVRDDDTSSSPLSHPHRAAAREYTASPFHGLGGVTERDPTV